MTTAQIEVLFLEVIEEKAVYKNLTGISEDKIYNWRKVRGPKPTIGDMLGVLYQLNKITINEFTPITREFCRPNTGAKICEENALRNWG